MSRISKNVNMRLVDNISSLKMFLLNCSGKKSVFVFSIFLLSFYGYSQTNYTTVANGDYNDCAIWVPTCPPSNIPLGDTVTISHDVNMTSNVDIEGAMFIELAGMLSGGFDIDIATTGALHSDGTIDITNSLHIDGSFFNTGYTTVLDVHNDGYICNSGTIEIDPAETFNNHGGTIECGGLLLVCELDIHENGGIPGDVSNQDVCCSTGGLPVIDLEAGSILDSVSVSLCGDPLMVNAGPDSLLTACNFTTTIIDLNLLLVGADAGGVWTEAVPSGVFNAAAGTFDISGLAAGDYVFSYTVSSPVASDDVAVITIRVEEEVFAGVDASVNLCNNIGSALNLNTLIGAADLGGTWFETTSSGMFNPATGVLNAEGLAVGTYSFEYVVLGVSPCMNDTGFYDVVIFQAALAGADSSMAICNTAGSFVDMNLLLAGADAGGVWAETSASGVFDAATGIFTTDGLAAGIYTFTYTVAGTLPCGDDVADFTVRVEREVFAGADSSIAICNTAGSFVDMNSLLVGADLGNVWIETSASGAFVPATGIFTTEGLAAGDYTFIYAIAGVFPCGDDVADFTVRVEEEVFAGADSVMAICNTVGSFVDMNSLLVGADAGGAWTETSGSGAFVPATGIFTTDGLVAGDYTFTYTVAGMLPCGDDIADFTVRVEEEVFAGADSSMAICNTVGSFVDMNSLLIGADAGGVWMETSGSGAFVPATGIFTTDGLAAADYTFTYTVTGVLPCGADVADFTVRVEEEVFAGADSSTAICNTAGSFVDMNSLLLGADAGGVWTETSTSGVFDAATGIFTTDGLVAGDYTFTYAVTGVLPCGADLADFMVRVEEEVFAGADSSMAICNTVGSFVDMNLLLLGADASGVWAETSTSGTFDTVTGIFTTDGLAAADYTFTYTVAGVAPCSDAVADFVIRVKQEVDAGDDAVTSICNTAGSFVDMNTLLVGADAGGTWTETSASGAFDVASGVLNTDDLAAGDYTFVYTVSAVAPCVDDFADFTVRVEEEVFAGADSSMAICNTIGDIVNMNSLLAGADFDGIWNETTDSGVFIDSLGLFNISDLTGGIYEFTYTVSAVAPCALDVSNFSVQVNEIPSITPLINEELCHGEEFESQEFNADVAGTTFEWSVDVGGDVGFGTSGIGNSVGTFFGNNPDVIDETVVVEVVPTAAGCIGSVESFEITVHALPQVDFYATDSLGCTLFRTQVVNMHTVSPGSSCLWTFGNGTSSNNCVTAVTDYATVGSFDVNLHIINAYGCENELEKENFIETYPEVIADFSFEPTSSDILDSEVEFYNLSENSYNFHWDFGDDDFSTSTDPVHSFPGIGNVSYNVELIAFSPAGCHDTITKPILIEDVIIYYVPNTFTPDGNTINNVFKPVIASGVDVYNYHLSIFNRWGELLFESYDPAYGWDGTYGGELASDGTYVWKISFKETMSDQRHDDIGNINLLR